VVELEVLGTDTQKFEIGATYDSASRTLTDTGELSSLARAEFRKVINSDFMECLFVSIKEMMQYFAISDIHTININKKDERYSDCLHKLFPGVIFGISENSENPAELNIII
jgi:hypothetical protein